MKRGRVRGVPGSGKTGYLIGLIAKAAEKYGASRVGAISYTNAAVEEIKDRAIRQAGFNPTEAANIRTIHSHCWRLLGLRKDRHAESQVKAFNEIYPEFALSSGRISEDSIENGQTRANDRMMTEINIMRSRMIPETQWSPDLRYLWESWRDWMAENDLVDYTGMLERCLKLGMAPDIDVLFIDEAQDMNVLQGRLTELWAEDTVSTIWCGDSDQAIFRFAGSDPAVFDQMSVEWDRLLDQSYRVPIAIHAFASEILSQIQKRTRIDFKPTKVKGAVSRVSEPDFSLPGRHMLICRCQYQVRGWIEKLMTGGILWENPYRITDLTWNPQQTKMFRAINAYYRLTTLGQELGLSEIKAMAELARSKGNMVRGAKQDIALMEAIENKEDIFGIQGYGFTPEFFEAERSMSDKFFLKGKIAPMLCRFPEVTVATPKVIVGTIHSIKGGEADHVWVDMALPGVIHGEIESDMAIRDDELRVLYVACTRAKQTLGLINSDQGVL